MPLYPVVIEVTLAKISFSKLMPIQSYRGNTFHGKRPLWELKLAKKGKTSIFIVNKRLREAKVKFLTEHDKEEFTYCIITLYIEEAPDTNISDTSNELKQVSVHNCFYISGKGKHTLIANPISGLLGFILIPKAIN